MQSTSTPALKDIFEESSDLTKKKIIDEKLESLVEELAVPTSKYEEAKERYESIGLWLNAEDSELAQYNPVIYPHGSFGLGTATKHYKDDDYDVDAVCVLQIHKGSITQKYLKNLVGNRLKLHGTYARILDPKEGGRRCWTLQYSDSSHFHLDILPAIPDDSKNIEKLGVPTIFAQHTICITDKETWDLNEEWPKSNPQGYLEWFKQRMIVALEKSRRDAAKRDGTDIKEIPDYKLRTPLQKAIQLLKRHRDIRYSGDTDKPISIIITTLAAQSYNNEESLSELLLNIIPAMRDHIEKRGTEWWVPNPVNPLENFADKWNETPRKMELFFEWLNSIEEEHNKLFSELDAKRIDSDLAKSYRYTAPKSQTVSLVPAKTQALMNVPHRQQPLWPVTPTYQISVQGRFKKKDGTTDWQWFESGKTILPTACDLLFHAETNTPAPFSVFWQVVNTGEEALRAKQLRGQIFPAKTAGVGGLTQKEATAYQGTHWIECFVVKNGTCVARSNEFLVNIESGSQDKEI